MSATINQTKPMYNIKIIVDIYCSLTLSGQNCDADAWVAEFDKRRVARFPVLLTDQKDIFGTHIPMS